MSNLTGKKRCPLVQLLSEICHFVFCKKCESSPNCHSVVMVGIRDAVIFSFERGETRKEFYIDHKGDISWCVMWNPNGSFVKG